MPILINGELQKYLESDSPLLSSTEKDHPINYNLQIQPASVDLRLSRIFLKMKPDVLYVDFLEDQFGNWEQFTVEETEPVILNPGEFILGQTLERINLPSNMTAKIEARQSIARLGLSICMAKYMNPGYQGKIPLQMKNVSANPIILRPYIRICTIIFEQLEKNVITPYDKRENAKYLDESDIMASKLQLDPEILNKIVSTQNLEKLLLENNIVIPNEDTLFFSKFFEDTTKRIISEAYFIAKTNGRDQVGIEDIKKGSENIRKILEQIVEGH